MQLYFAYLSKRAKESIMRAQNLHKLFGLAALVLPLVWILHQPTSLPADDALIVHIFYSSDAQGYHEPCG
jgi:hypothetical protein